MNHRELLSRACSIHQIFGAAEVNTLEDAEHHLRHIYTEMEEFMEAEDDEERADALLDMYMFSIGFNMRYRPASTITKLIEVLITSAFPPQYDFFKSFEAVLDAQMSKICVTKQDVEDTVHYYTERGVKVYEETITIVDEFSKTPEGDDLKTPAVLVRVDGTQEVDGVLYLGGKVLKNVNMYAPAKMVEKSDE